jgi:hypothetical protein
VPTTLVATVELLSLGLGNKLEGAMDVDPPQMCHCGPSLAIHPSVWLGWRPCNPLGGMTFKLGIESDPIGSGLTCLESSHDRPIMGHNS